MHNNDNNSNNNNPLNKYAFLHSQDRLIWV